jgi:hypothetical protein
LSFASENQEGHYQQSSLHPLITPSFVPQHTSQEMSVMNSGDFHLSLILPDPKNKFQSPEFLNHIIMKHYQFNFGAISQKIIAHNSDFLKSQTIKDLPADLTWNVFEFIQLKKRRSVSQYFMNQAGVFSIKNLRFDNILTKTDNPNTNISLQEFFHNTPSVLISLDRRFSYCPQKVISNFYQDMTQKIFDLTKTQTIFTLTPYEDNAELVSLHKAGFERIHFVTFNKYLGNKTTYVVCHKQRHDPLEEKIRKEKKRSYLEAVSQNN